MATPMSQMLRAFEETSKQLENGLQVNLIATPNPICLDETDNVERLLADESLRSFDFFPVRRDDRVVGVLCRRPINSTGSDDPLIEPLDESMLTAANHPIGTFLEEMINTPFQLVVSGGHIEGIITRSDLLKLPVRLHAFMVVTNLEAVMASTIKTAFHDRPCCEYLGLLADKRCQMVCRKRNDHAANSLDPDVIEFTELCDKREILKKHFRLGKSFERDLKEIEKVRNKVVHAASYAESMDKLRSFVASLQSASYWAAELSHKQEQILAKRAGMTPPAS